MYNFYCFVDIYRWIIFMEGTTIDIFKRRWVIFMEGTTIDIFKRR